MERVLHFIRQVRNARFDVINRRENFTMLLQATIEFGHRYHLVRNDETEDARKVLDWLCGVV